MIHFIITHVVVLLVCNRSGLSNPVYLSLLWWLSSRVGLRVSRREGFKCGSVGPMGQLEGGLVDRVARPNVVGQRFMDLF